MTTIHDETFKEEPIEDDIEISPLAPTKCIHKESPFLMITTQGNAGAIEAQHCINHDHTYARMEKDPLDFEPLCKIGRVFSLKDNNDDNYEQESDKEEDLEIEIKEEPLEDDSEAMTSKITMEEDLTTEMPSTTTDINEESLDSLKDSVCLKGAEMFEKIKNYEMEGMDIFLINNFNKPNLH